MPNKNYFRLLFASLLLTVCAFSSYAQPAQKKLNRERTYDVQNYTIRVSFDRANKTVFGDTIVQLKPLKNNFNRIEFDAADMRFESVKLESGKDISFKT